MSAIASITSKHQWKEEEGQACAVCQREEGVGRCSCAKAPALCPPCYAAHMVEIEQRVNKFKAGFDAFDRDGNGSITVAELGEVMSELGCPVAPAQVEDLVEQVDVDRNGTIEFEEFLPLVAKMLAKVMRSYSELQNLGTICVDKMSGVRSQLEMRTVFTPERDIKHVALLVVVAEEIQPVLDKYKPIRNVELEKEMMGLAIVFECQVGDPGYKLTVLQVASSSIYSRHYSGATQASAIVSLAAKVFNPDLLMSFGTAGGMMTRVKIGDTLLGSGCVFIDRTRTSSKVAHDWGVYGGRTMKVSNIASSLNLVEGILGSQSNYNVSDLHVTLMDVLEVCAVDMEAASEAQIAEQIGLNFLAVKVISNGIYPGDGLRMEEEYVKHKKEVSMKALASLSAILDYLRGKKLGEL